MLILTECSEKSLYSLLIILRQKAQHSRKSSFQTRIVVSLTELQCNYTRATDFSITTSPLFQRQHPRPSVHAVEEEIASRKAEPTAFY